MDSLPRIERNEIPPIEKDAILESKKKAVIHFKHGPPVSVPSEAKLHEIEIIDAKKIKSTIDTANEVMNLVGSASAVSDVRELVHLFLAPNIDLFKAVFGLSDAFSMIETHHLHEAHVVLHGVHVAAEVAAVASVIHKYSVMQAALDWIEEKEKSSPKGSLKNVEEAKRFLNQEMDSLKEEALVQALAAGCSIHDLTAVILPILHISHPALTALSWFSVSLQLGLSAYAVAKAAKPLADQQKWIDSEFPLFPIHTSVQAPDILKYPALKPIEKLSDKIVKEKIREWKKNGGKDKPSAKDIEDFTRVKIIAFKEKLPQNSKLSKEQVIKLKNEARQQLSKAFKVSADSQISEFKLEAAKEALDELKHQQSEQLDYAGKKMYKLWTKRKEAFDVKMSETKEEFKQFIASLDNLSYSEIELRLKSKGIHLENIDESLQKTKKEAIFGVLQQSQTPESFNKKLYELKNFYKEHQEINKSEKLNQILEKVNPHVVFNEESEFWKIIKNEVSTDDLEKLLTPTERTIISDALQKPFSNFLKNNQNLLHKAYVEHRDMIDSSVKNILKDWMSQKMKIEKSTLVFNLSKASIGFGTFALWTVVTITLTILVATGTIVCPPVVFTLLTVALFAASVSLVAIGITYAAYKKPNQFETYFNGAQLKLIMAKIHHKVANLYYWKTAAEVSDNILTSDRGTRYYSAKEEESIKIRKYLHELEEKEAECQKKIDKAAWKDVSEELRLGNRGISSEEAIKNLTSLILSDDPAALGNVDYKALRENLKRYMGIELPQIQPSDKKEEIAVLVTEKIKKFLSQDASSLSAHIGSQL